MNDDCMNKSNPVNTVGIDVSKEKCDFHCLLTGENGSFEYNLKEIKAFITKMEKLKPDIILCENTGGYENRILIELTMAELPAAAVNPRIVRDFAKSLGLLCKTDKVDAKVIARFAKERDVKLFVLPTEQQATLQSLLVWRRQLTAQNATLKTQLQQATNRSVIEDIKNFISHYEKTIKKVDADIAILIKTDPVMSLKSEILQSVPGIGPTTAATLLNECSELGQHSQGEIASFVGVAPMNHDSGKFRGQRHIRGGRASIRRTLYMAAISAVITSKENNVFKELYKRLCSAGKARKVAMIACMRKMLCVINSLIKNGTKWVNKLSKNGSTPP